MFINWIDSKILYFSYGFSQKNQSLTTICEHLTLACVDGTKSGSCVSFHFIKNITWPLLFVAPENRKKKKKLVDQSWRIKCFLVLNKQFLFIYQEFFLPEPIFCLSKPTCFFSSGDRFFAVCGLSVFSKIYYLIGNLFVELDWKVIERTIKIGFSSTIYSDN